MKMTSNGRWPKNIKIEYLSNHWLDFTQIWNLMLGDQSKISKCYKYRRPPTEDDIKILKWNISATTGLILLKISAKVTIPKVPITSNEDNL